MQTQTSGDNSMLGSAGYSPNQIMVYILYPYSITDSTCFMRCKVPIVRTKPGFQRAILEQYTHTRANLEEPDKYHLKMTMSCHEKIPANR